VGAHSSRCGQRGGKQDISRAASSSSQQSRHRTNSPPHALKLFLCFVNHQSISFHDCSGGVRVWDTLLCLRTGVSYPGAFISPGTSPPEAARESEKPAGKSFEKFKGKDSEPLHLIEALGDNSVEMRAAALRSLEKLQDKEAAP